MTSAAATADPEMQRTIAFRARPYGLSDPYELFTEVNRYTLDGVVDKITTRC